MIKNKKVGGHEPEKDGGPGARSQYRLFAQ